METKRKDDFEPFWEDEKDWLCIVEFLPTDNPEARLFAAEIIGYLVGYANLTNTRSLALLGDPDASAYELLFSFSSPEEKNEFLNLVRSNEDMGNDYINEYSTRTRYVRWILLSGTGGMCVRGIVSHKSSNNRVRKKVQIKRPRDLRRATERCAVGF